MKKRQPNPPALLPGLAKGNIETIMRLQQDYLRQRSAVDRLSDSISRFVGSPLAVSVHIAIFSVWLVLNLGILPGFVPFDPYPFSFLALIIGMEAIFLATFVLMSQNRQAHQADHWAHLHLQIGLLAEQETTKILQLLQTMFDHLGLEHVSRDSELKEMAGRTAVGELAEELAQNLQKSHEPEAPPMPKK